MTPARHPLRTLALAAQPAVLLFLSACASSGGIIPQTGAATPSHPAIRQPVTRPVRSAQIHMEPGLEGVVGVTTADLNRQFGTPRLDVWEGDARKLQYTGTACVLDVYLYPMRAGAEPIATYVDARRSDGQDVNKAACVRALRR